MLVPGRSRWKLLGPSKIQLGHAGIRWIGVTPSSITLDLAAPGNETFSPWQFFASLELKTAENRWVQLGASCAQQKIAGISFGAL